MALNKTSYYFTKNIHYYLKRIYFIHENYSQILLLIGSIVKISIKITKKINIIKKNSLFDLKN